MSEVDRNQVKYKTQHWLGTPIKWEAQFEMFLEINKSFPLQEMVNWIVFVRFPCKIDVYMRSLQLADLHYIVWNAFDMGILKDLSSIIFVRQCLRQAVRWILKHWMWCRNYLRGLYRNISFQSDKEGWRFCLNGGLRRKLANINQMWRSCFWLQPTQGCRDTNTGASCIGQVFHDSTES